MAGKFYLLDWTRELNTHEAYIAALDFVIKFYNSNFNFRIDVARSTAKVLSEDSISCEDSEAGKRYFGIHFLGFALFFFFFSFAI